MKTLFETTELYLASYLKSQGVELHSIEKGFSDKYKFIFIRKEDTMELVTDWYSEKTESFRAILQTNAELRFNLKTLANNNNKIKKYERHINN